MDLRVQAGTGTGFGSGTNSSSSDSGSSMVVSMSGCSFSRNTVNSMQAGLISSAGGGSSSGGGGGSSNAALAAASANGDGSSSVRGGAGVYLAGPLRAYLRGCSFLGNAAADLDPVAINITSATASGSAAGAACGGSSSSSNNSAGAAAGSSSGSAGGGGRASAAGEMMYGGGLLVDTGVQALALYDTVLDRNCAVHGGGSLAARPPLPLLLLRSVNVSGSAATAGPGGGVLADGCAVVAADRLLLQVRVCYCCLRRRGGGSDRCLN